MHRFSQDVARLCLPILAIGLCSGVCAGERKVVLTSLMTKVGQYERMDFSIHFDGRYKNPFDSTEVDLSLVLRTPEGQEIAVPAYFGQDYEYRQRPRGERTTDWFYPVGQAGWRARCAPTSVGAYSAVARLKDPQGEVKSQWVQFECTASNHKGYLGVSKTAPRFLELSDGRPFFAIGQNLAFIGEGQYVTLSRANEIFPRLAQNGANFLRIWTGCEDWALAIEARKSAWGRSWGGRTPTAPMPGQEANAMGRKCVKLGGQGAKPVEVAPSHPLAVRENTRYVLSGKVQAEGDARLAVEIAGSKFEIPSSERGQKWAPFRHEFITSAGQWWLDRLVLHPSGPGIVYLDGLSLTEAGGGPELLLEADVNRPARGYYHQLDCAMLDHLLSSAERNGLYVQLCLFTRDLYMGSLKNDSSPEYDEAIADAKRLLRYAVARWGYSTSVGVWEYFNEIDPGLPTDRFYTECGQYLQTIDPYHHLRTTSTWHPSPKDWRHPELDMAQMHQYLRPVLGEAWKDEVAMIVEKTQFLKKETPRGPVILGEFGLADDRWGLSPFMKQDRDLVHFHNSLWASAMSGAAGTAMFWWWEQLDQQDCYDHYRPLANFLSDIPLTRGKLKDLSATVTPGHLRPIGLQEDDRAYFWLFDPQAAWWKVVVERTTPAEIQGASIQIAGLAPGVYRATWWDTRTGETAKEERSPQSGGIVRFSVPAFSRDVACKVVPETQ